MAPQPQAEQAQRQPAQEPESVRRKPDI